MKATTKKHPRPAKASSKPQSPLWQHLATICLGLIGYLITFYAWLGILLIALWTIFGGAMQHALQTTENQPATPVTATAGQASPLSAVIVSVIMLPLSLYAMYYVSQWVIDAIRYVMRLTKVGFLTTRLVVLTSGCCLLALGEVSFLGTSIPVQLALATAVAYMVGLVSFALEWGAARIFNLELPVMVRRARKDRKATV